MSSKIKSLFSQIQNIPQIPEVIKILIEQVNNPDIDLKDIASNVEKEPLIAIKVLRVVNSAYFGLPKKIDSINDAVVLLGMYKLRTLVIASGIVNAIPDIENFNIKKFWLNSFRTASYSKCLANMVGLDEDIAFTAGLINDLGTVLIYLGQPKEAIKIEELINEGHSRSFVEKMRLGYISQDVSAELCRLWRFSDELIIPVLQCESPLVIEPVSKIACVISIAKYLSYCKEADIEQDHILEGLSVDVVGALQLPEEFFVDKLDEILSLESGLDGMLE